MKLILVLLIPITVFGQKAVVEGKFCTETEYVGSCIEFLSNDSVAYHYWSCMLIYDKFGTYEITEDSLILKFRPLKKQNSMNLLSSEVHVEYKAVDNADYIDLEISTMKSGTNELLPFALIQLSLSNKPNAHEILRTTITDENGKAGFRLKKESFEYWLISSGPNLAEKIVKVTSDSSSLVTFHLAERDPYDVDYNRLSFEIAEITNNQIKLYADAREYDIVLIKK